MKKLLFILLLCTSCGITKDKIKTSEDSKINKTETTITKTFDFGVIDVKDVSLDYTPIDPAKQMSIDTSEKGVLKTTNARLKKSNTTTKESKNIKEEAIIDAKQDETKTTNTVDKKKEEVFNPQVLIYAIGALALIVVIGFGLFAFMFIKIQKAMPNMVASSIKELIN